MSGLPYFKFYTSDFLGSSKVGMMKPAEVGAYVLLLSHAWSFGGILPNDDEVLANLARMSEQDWAKAKARVKACFVERGDQLVNEKLERMHGEAAETVAKQSDAGKKGAGKRWTERKPETVGKAIEKASEADKEATGNRYTHGDPISNPNGEANGEVYSNSELIAQSIHTHTARGEIAEPGTPLATSATTPAEPWWAECRAALDAWAQAGHGRVLVAHRGETQKCRTVLAGLAVGPPIGGKPRADWLAAAIRHLMAKGAELKLGEKSWDSYLSTCIQNTLTKWTPDGPEVRGHGGKRGGRAGASGNTRNAHYRDACDYDEDLRLVAEPSSGEAA